MTTTIINSIEKENPCLTGGNQAGGATKIDRSLNYITEVLKGSQISYPQVVRLFAQFYLELGWYLLPCHGIVNKQCTCGNPQCPSPGKHPLTRNGVKEATNDLNVLLAYLEQEPNLNLALATGEKSGVLVLDIDDFETARQVIQEYTIPRDTLVQRTGKGVHLFFRYPEDWRGVSLPNKLKDKVEIKGNGRYVMICPARHIKGVFYKLGNVKEAAKKGSLLGDLPPQLKEAIEAKKTQITINYNLVDHIPKGKVDWLEIEYIPQGKKKAIKTRILYVPPGLKVPVRLSEVIYNETTKQLIYCRTPKSVICKVLEMIGERFCERKLTRGQILELIQRYQKKIVDGFEWYPNLSTGFIPEGSRNTTLFEVGCVLKWAVIGEEILGAILDMINLELCRPPLEQREVYRIAKSITEYVVSRVLRSQV